MSAPIGRRPYGQDDGDDLVARFRLWILGLATGVVMANAVLFHAWWHLVFLVLGFALIGLAAFLMTRPADRARRSS